MEEAHSSMWTNWCNSDRPWVGHGDTETVSSIHNHCQLCESGYEIEAAQCMNTLTNVIFTESSAQEVVDRLRVPCTSQGVQCYNTDQSHGETCSDYAVRFLCQYTGNDDDGDDHSGDIFPQFDVRIYIILAVVPILIFLIRIIWVYAFRRRRQLQRQRESSRRRRILERLAGRGRYDDDDNSSTASDLGHPPPSYNELFGAHGTTQERPSVFTISRGNVPVCEKCNTEPCSIAVALVTDIGNQNSPSLQRVTSPCGTCCPAEHVTSLAVSVLQREAESTDSTIARVTQTVDNIAVEMDSRSMSENVNGQTAAATDVDCENPVDSASGGSRVPTVNPLNLFDQVQIQDETILAARGTSSLQTYSETDAATATTTTTTTTTAAAPSPLQQQHRENPHNAPTDAGACESGRVASLCHGISQPCACVCHRTVPFPSRGLLTSAYDNGAFNHDGEFDEEEQRRLRSALSGVPVLHRVWSNLSSTSVVTLTELPSYEDALELMKKKGEDSERTLSK